MIAAIFDLDGTLYTGHIVKGIARHHRVHQVKRLPLTFYMVTHMTLWPLWRLGLLSETIARELWVSHLGWTIRGWTRKEVKDMALFVFALVHGLSGLRMLAPREVDLEAQVKLLETLFKQTNAGNVRKGKK